MIAALAPPVQRLTFKLGSSVLGLDVSDAAVLDLVETTYAPMRCEPIRGSQQFTACVRRLADGRLHARFGRRALPVPPAAGQAPIREAYYATREIFARFAASLPGSIAFYGAAFGVNGAGVLVLGPATIGKTLLALHAAHRGAHFLGDETAMLSLRAGEICAMPRRPAIRESALPLLPSDAMRASVGASPRAFNGERGRFWYALDADDLQGVAPSERRFPLRAIFVVRSRAVEPAIRRIDLASAVPMVAQRAYARPSELGEIAALRHTLRKAACFDMTLGAPGESAEALLREASACA